MLGLFRRRPSRAAARFVPTVECLEGRLVPAGTINSSYSNVTKTLTLTAVNVPNLIDVNHQSITISGTGTAGEFTVTGNAAETILGVAADLAPISNVQNIKLVMGLGNDVVSIRNAELSGKLTFLGGDGSNELDIDGTGGGNTLGRVSVTNGEGNDDFVMHNGINEITGKLTINNGQGDGTTDFGQLAGDLTAVGGAVSITNGAGSLDEFRCKGQQVQFGNAVTIRNGSGGTALKLEATAVNSINGTLTVVNGDGCDRATLGNGGVGSVSFGGVNIRNGTGDSTTEFLGNTHTITGNLLIRNGDGNDVLNCPGATSVTVTGAVTIQNGAGDTTIAWDAATTTTIGGLMTLSSTTGVDAITFGSVTANLHSVKILTGNGESNIALDSSALTMTGSLTVVGGRDDDRLQTPSTANLNVTGSVSITLGNSSNIAQSVIFFGTTTIGGKLTIRGGDQRDRVDLFSTDVGGTVLLDLRNGDDQVQIHDSTFAAAVTITVGAGIDDISVESTNNVTGTTFNGPVTVLGGSGDDLLAVGLNINNFATFNAAPVKFDGGSGLDTLDLTVFNVFPPNQPIELRWEAII